MVELITSLSRITLIAYVLIFAIIDIILLATRKNETVKEIFSIISTLLVYFFLINAAVVVIMNTKDNRCILIFVGQLILCIVGKIILKRFYPNVDSYLLNNIFMLLNFSFVMLQRLDMAKAVRQVLFTYISLVICCFVCYVLKHIKNIKFYYLIYFILSVILTLFVLFFGAKEYGAKLSISFGNISFQTSEFVKILFVFFLSSVIYVYKDFRGFLYATIGSVVLILCLVLCKDLGAALIFVTTYMVVVFVAYRKYIIFFGEIILGGVCGVVAYNTFSHIQTRFIAWSDPLSVIDNQGYQICQSLFAIGTGKWLGSGLFQGQPTKIPVVSKDFIFSAIAEEFGCIVGISLIVIFLCICIFILISAIETTDSFYGLVTVGFAIIISMQTILNIGGVIKFIPSTGVTLPLISYGGSSLLSMLIMYSVVYYNSTLAVDAISKRTADNRKEVLYGLHKKEILILCVVIFTLFLSMIGYFIHFIIIDSKEYVYNSYNSRYATYAKNIIRGDIITADNKMIAYTDTSDGDEKRIYPCKELFCHAVGYVDEGMSGLESQFAFELLDSHSSISKRVLNQKSKKKVEGDMLVTTFDYDTQLAAYQAMGTKKGAVIAIEPETGKILAMVSKPDFDPNLISDYWTFITDETNDSSILLNRTTQGLYPPGSIFKIVTTIDYLRENNNETQNFSFDCNSKLPLDDFVIHCSGNKKHGHENLQDSFANSCNCAYAYLGTTLDIPKFNDTANNLLFNQKLPANISDIKKSKFDLSANAPDELIGQTAMGQGNTLVSPIHMCMLVSAIANDGELMVPYTVDSVRSIDGFIVKKFEPSYYDTIFTAKETAILQKYMQSVIEYGTCENVDFNDYDVYGKTGTAEYTNDKKLAHSWFVGYAKNEAGKDIAVAVIMEGAGYGSKYAAPCAAKVFDAYLSK